MVKPVLVNRRPDLFLSHSSADKDLVTKLAKDLLVCEVDAWFDKWEIGPGDSLLGKINEGITDSRYIAILLSRSFLGNTYPMTELRAAHSRQIKEGNIIIPLLLEEVEVPFMLADLLHVNLANDYFAAVAKIAGRVHRLRVADIDMAIQKIHPVSLEDVIKTLRYAGKDVYMIVPKEVFDEIAGTGMVEVENGRLWFKEVDTFAIAEKVSPRSVDYIRRLNGTGQRVQ
jgi:hypothetical protein